MGDCELFGTKDLAEAFVAGMERAIDMIDDEHSWVNPPIQITSGEWQVNFGTYFLAHAS
jgi:hypothetical protein